MQVKRLRFVGLLGWHDPQLANGGMARTGHHVGAGQALDCVLPSPGFFNSRDTRGFRDSSSMLASGTLSDKMAGSS
jgi:hypothetical protein